MNIPWPSDFDLPWPAVKVPSYQEGRKGRWKMDKTKGSMPGYFTPQPKAGNVWALKRKERGIYLAWMSITAMELESQMPHIAAATGHTVVMGLGMGVYLYNIIAKPEVERVTVIERDTAVLDIFFKVTNFHDWPGAEKVNIIQADALTWKPNKGDEVDFLYVDIWKNLADKAAEGDTKKIIANVKPAICGFWTQEFEFVHAMRERGIKVPDITFKNFQDYWAEYGCRMVGDRDADYMRLCIICVYVQTMASMVLKKDIKAAVTLSMACYAEIEGYLHNRAAVQVPALSLG